MPLLLFTPRIFSPDIVSYFPATRGYSPPIEAKPVVKVKRKKVKPITAPSVNTELQAKLANEIATHVVSGEKPTILPQTVTNKVDGTPLILVKQLLDEEDDITAIMMLLDYE